MATFRIDDDLLAAMRAYYEREGVQISEQVRRGIRMWLESKGVAVTREAAKLPRRRKGATR